MTLRTATIGLSLLLAAQPAAPAQRRAAPHKDPAPVRPRTCAFTHVRQVTQRLEEGVTHRVIPDSGSAVAFANGLYQVSYDQVRAVNGSRPWGTGRGSPTP